MAESLLIPIAHDHEGMAIFARNADRNERYVCPGCTQRVVLRAGAVRQTHFAHLPGFAGHGEGETHRLAKHHIALLLEENRRNEPARFPVAEPCGVCAQPLYRRLPPFARVAVEWRVNGERRVDVALLGATDTLVMVVEVRVSNATDPERAAPVGVPWIEVDVSDGPDPANWRVVARHPGRVCADCAPDYKRRRLLEAEQKLERRLAESVAHDVDPPVDAVWPTITHDQPAHPPRSPYETRRVTCRSCGADQPYFVWEGKTAPEPRPPTVRRYRLEFPSFPIASSQRALPDVPEHVAAAMVRGWGNVCGACGELL
jgi:hypothetical protein